MKYIIDEIGEKTKIRTMTINEAKKMIDWGAHTDRLFANYDFPKFDNAQLISWFKKKNSPRRAIMSILDHDENIVGYMTLRDINKIFKTSELGILLNPDKINQGYGTDAIYTMTKWYFQKLKYKKLFLRVAMYNKRAFKVYNRLGFEPMYTLYEEFNNDEIDVFEDEKYSNIKKYFKTSFHKIYVKCIKMKLSTK